MRRVATWPSIARPRAAACLEKIIPVDFRGTMQCYSYEAYDCFAKGRGVGGGKRSATPCDMTTQPREPVANADREWETEAMFIASAAIHDQNPHEATEPND
jgi:hypothetical protein